MKRLHQIQIFCVLLSALLLSCATPSVQISLRPISDSPMAERESLTSSSVEVLQRDGLQGLYRSDPDAALRSLYQRYQREGGVERLVAVAELCGALGMKRQATAPAAAAGCYLDAARISHAAAFRYRRDVKDREMRLIYNASCASLTGLLFSQGHDWSRTSRFDGPLRTTQFSLGHAAKGDIAPDFFDVLVPADRIVLKHINLKRERRGGVGGAMVGHHERDENGGPIEQFVSNAGLAIPVNAVLEFPSHGRAVLVLRDLIEVDTLRASGRSIPLAADWTASLGYIYRDAPKKDIGFQGLLHPKDYNAQAGLSLTGRFDPDKIPVVLVHGLMSSPETWITALSQLRSDPILRHHYQAVLFRYPTGYAINVNANTLRQSLANFQTVYDPLGKNPKMRRMVVVCHSMGGNLTDLQIRDTGDAFVKLNFELPLDDLDINPQQREDLRDLLVFQANPDIARVIYLATPHRGSKLAINLIGWLGNKLINIPIFILNNGITASGLAELPHLTPFGEQQVSEKLDSIRSLRPDNPNFSVIEQIPSRKGTITHSIIGQVNQSKPITEGTDKVVEYWSSHLDGTASEKIVDSSHTQITGNEDAIEEVRRLLYLHIGHKYDSN